MFRPSSPARPERRHRRERQSFGAWISVVVGRGAAVAVAGGLLLVGLVVGAVLLGSPDPGSRPLGAEPGSRGTGEGDRQGDLATTGPSVPTTTAPADGPEPSSSARTPQATPAAPPPQTSRPPQPAPSEPPASEPTKRHGKSQKDKPHPTPGHGSTHGPGKP